MSTQTGAPRAAKPKTKQTWKVILLVLVGVAMGAGFGFGIGKAIKPSATGLHVQPWTLLLLPPLFFAVVGLHEAGHVAAGLACGFKFALFSAGPMRIDRNGDRLRVVFHWKPSLMWGGFAACVPRQADPRLSRRMALFVAGGPLFSLVGALVLIPAYSLRHWSANAACLLFLFGCVSGLIALATLAPVRMAGSTSDGARLLMLLRNGREGRRWTAMALISGYLHAMDTRPRDWPADLVEELGDGREGEADAASSCLLRYLRHYDLRDWERAAEWLDRGLSIIESAPPYSRGGWYLAAAGFEARHRGNGALARQYFEQALTAAKLNPKDLHTTRAAVLIAEGKRDEARTELDLAWADLNTRPGPLKEFRREAIEELRAAVDRVPDVV